MNDPLMDAFDECLSALEQGQTLEECLLKYPRLAEELRPRLKALLLTRKYVETLQPGVGNQAAAREKFLAQASAIKSQSVTQGSPLAGGNHYHGPAEFHPNRTRTSFRNFIDWLLHPLANQAVRLVALLLVIVLTGAGAMNASAQSLPGSPLYGLKRMIENTQLALTPNSASRVQLQTEFSERRLQELQAVTGKGVSASVEFGGQLTILGAGQWLIDGIRVTIPDGIQINGSPGNGLYAWFQGQTQTDRSVIASQVTIEGTRVQGIVKNIASGVWQVNTWNIYTSDDTQVEGDPRPGDLVEINVWVLPDGSWLAEQIRLVAHPAGAASDGQNGPAVDDNGTDEPTQTSGGEDGKSGKPTQPAPQLTSTPSSQGSPGPSPTQTSQSGDGSVKTAEPAQSAEPTRTPELTKTPEPTRTIQATQTPNSGNPTPAPTTFQSQEVRSQGVLQSIQGSTWVMDGQAFQVDSNTSIENNPQVGDTVEVRANTRPDGSLLATRIRKQ